MARVRHAPQFPVSANVNRGATFGTSVFLFSTPAELRVSPLSPVHPTSSTNPGQLRLLVTIYMPAGTDIRVPAGGPLTDFVELPAGSGRWYNVVAVEDLARGFANQFRVAWCFQLIQPFPLP